MEHRKTITTIFMVPTLKITKETLRENGFINAFEFDEGQDVTYPNAIYLLFKPTNLHVFRAFLNDEYERTTNIIDDYDYSGGFVVVVYRLDKRFESDFNLIRQSKYSKTSKKFQAEFPKMTRILKDGELRDEVSLQFRVFNKTKDMVEFWEDKLGVKLDENQEVWQAYDLEKEILNSVKLEEYV
jgi:hypothetical protein